MNESHTRLFARGVAAVVLAAAMTAPATGAFAADNGDVHGDTGASWGPNDAAAKARIAQLTAAASGGLTTNGVCPFSVTPDARPATSTASLATASITPASCPGIPPVTRTLPVGWQQQATTYWCGPATVAMASSYYGTGRSQTSVASYIGTTTAGSDRNQVARGMNWVSNKTTYTPISAPSGATITAALRADIGLGGAPVAVNTHETSNVLDHYNNHPNRATGIGHFVLAIGYTNGGQTVLINDPASGLKGYEKSAQQFWISAGSLATFVNDRGIVA